MKSKSKKVKPKTLKNKIWKLCRELTRKKYGMDCYTCERKNLEGKDCHTGHFIPSSSGLILRYDLRNLRPQCYNCNINLGGNGAEFYRRMVEREGQEYVNNLFKLKELVVFDKSFLENKLLELSGMRE